MVLCPEHIWNPIFFSTSCPSYSGLSSHPLSVPPTIASSISPSLLFPEYLKSLNQVRFPKTLLQWCPAAIKIKLRVLPLLLWMCFAPPSWHWSPILLPSLVVLLEVSPATQLQASPDLWHLLTHGIHYAAFPLLCLVAQLCPTLWPFGL